MMMLLSFIPTLKLRLGSSIRYSWDPENDFEDSRRILEFRCAQNFLPQIITLKTQQFGRENPNFHEKRPIFRFGSGKWCDLYPWRGGGNNVRCRRLMPVTQYCTERAYAMTTRHGGSIERVMWSCFTAEVPTSERLQRWVCRTQCCHDHHTQTLPLLSNNHSLSVIWVVCGKGLENADDLCGWKGGGY